MTTWRELFEEAFIDTGDSFENLICTLTDEEMDREFDAGYGVEQGKPFTAWSENHVYFPLCHDGSEWVGWAYRNPCGKAMKHQGGG